MLNALISPQLYEVWNLTHPFFGLAAFLLGACIGSFGNVCIWRMPRRESVVIVPSHCPSCDAHIAWYMNIPLLSWLVLRGRCWYCKTAISCRYPLVEAIVGALFVLCWLKVTASPYGEPGLPLASLIPMWFVVSAAVVISLIDLEHFVIPSPIVVTGLILATVLAIAMPAGHFLDYSHYASRHHHMLTHGFLSFVLPAGSSLLESARFVATVDLVLGIVHGGGILYVLGLIGDLLFPMSKHSSDEGAEILIEQDALTVDGETGEWDDWLPRYKDEIRITGRLTPTGAEPVEIIATDTGVKVGETFTPREKIEAISVKATAWTLPQIAMGMGDVKLMAMIGAFFGPDGVLRILFVGCVLGSAIGVTAWVIAKLRRRPTTNKVAFGVPLMVAAVLHMMLF